MRFSDIMLLLAMIPGTVLFSIFIDDLVFSWTDKIGGYLQWVGCNLMWWIKISFYILFGMAGIANIAEIVFGE